MHLAALPWNQSLWSLFLSQVSQQSKIRLKQDLIAFKIEIGGSVYPPNIGSPDEERKGKYDE